MLKSLKELYFLILLSHWS